MTVSGRTIHRGWRKPIGYRYAGRWPMTDQHVYLPLGVHLVARLWWRLWHDAGLEAARA